MSIDTHYQAPKQSLWQGRYDSPPGSSFFQVIKMLNLTQQFPPASKQLSFALLGFSCEEGIRRNLGRTGAAEGPDALRSVLGKLPIHRHHISIYDAGNIVCQDHDLENAQAALGDAVHLLLSNGMIPIVIGGGHEMAWGHYQGIAKHHPKLNLGIVNLDTHFDMRPMLENHKGSSGTPFLQIAAAHETERRRFDYNCIGIQACGNTQQLYSIAEKHHAKILAAEDVHAHPELSKDFINRVIHDNDGVYLSLCLDVFSAAYAPGVSAPQAFGLTPWDVIPIIRIAAESGKVVSYDIAELSPKYDIDSRTIKLTANFVHEIIHHHALTN